MKKIRLTLPPITVVHPNDPEVTVTMDRPTVEDQQKHSRNLAPYQKYVAVLHPETKEVLYGPNHQPIMFALPVAYPLSVMYDFFEPLILDVTGVETDGGPLPWNKANAKAILRGFFDPAFSVKQEVEKPELDDAGQPTGKTVKDVEVTPWFNYLVNRLNEPEDAGDPLASSAAPTSSHSASAD